MIALLGSLAGFTSAFIPELFNFLKDRKDKEHELKLIGLQIEAMKSGQHSRLEEIYVRAEAQENQYLYSHAKPTGIKWVDSLSALVRPTITYSFFLLYIVLKLLIFFSSTQGICIPIWTDEDQAIFCAVIGFWFGARAFGKYRINGTSAYGSNDGK